MPYFWRPKFRILSLEFFIAQRMLPNRSQGIKVSRPIIRIAMISIALSIVVNLLTFAVVTGFQNEIRRKVTGFAAPLFIQLESPSDFYESPPLQRSQQVEKALNQNEGVLRFNRVAFKPGLIQSTVGTEVIGLLFKGIDADYDFAFLKDHLTQGKLPKYRGETVSDEIVLSEKVCKQLKLKLHEEISAFFVKDAPVSRRFRIVGIYNTGFEDYDEKLGLCDIRVTQSLNEWGCSGELELKDTLMDSKMVLMLNIQGNGSDLHYDWGNGLSPYRGKLIPIHTKDTSLQVKVYQQKNHTIRCIDTHSIHIKYLRTLAKTSEHGTEVGIGNKFYMNSKGNQYQYLYPVNDRENWVYDVTIHSGQGTAKNFISGYEVHLKDWYQLDTVSKKLKSQLSLIPNENGELVKVASILDLEFDLFNWLSFLDINVIIIVVLMLLIGIINMGSALLVLIIIRSNFIGLMKAMGANNASLRKIFLIQAGYLIGKGMLYGNLFGLAIYFLQTTTGFLSLNPDVYYLDKVPMELNVSVVILLNLGSFLICIMALLLPSALISRVNPVKTIKFN